MTVITHTATAALQQPLEQRHICRAFRSDPVPRDTIEQLLTPAQRAPSWCNNQPWRVIITSGEGTEQVRADLQEWVRSQAPRPDIAFPERYEGESQERRRECA